jgi:hypothetical protein
LPEEAIGVREERLYQDRPRLLVDLSICDVEMALAGIRAAVGEDQLEFGLIL